MNFVESLMGVVVPITMATVSTASVYFVFAKVQFPAAGMFSAIVFVIVLMQTWGETEVEMGI